MWGKEKLSLCKTYQMLLPSKQVQTTCPRELFSRWLSFFPLKEGLPHGLLCQESGSWKERGYLAWNSQVVEQWQHRNSLSSRNQPLDLKRTYLRQRGTISTAGAIKISLQTGMRLFSSHQAKTSKERQVRSEKYRATVTFRIWFHIDMHLWSTNTARRDSRGYEYPEESCQTSNSKVYF